MTASRRSVRLGSPALPKRTPSAPNTVNSSDVERLDTAEYAAVDGMERIARSDPDNGMFSEFDGRHDAEVGREGRREAAYRTRA